MNPRPMVFFDIETSGLEPDSEITQLAAIAVELPSFKELDTFEQKIHFDPALADLKALELNHYDPQVWAAEALYPGDAYESFARWLRRWTSIQMTSKKGQPYAVAQMVGYNSENFDQFRLQKAFKEMGLYYPAHYRTLDVLQLAAWHAVATGDKGPSLKLGEVYYRLRDKAPPAQHDALTNVRMTVAVARAIWNSLDL